MRDHAIQVLTEEGMACGPVEVVSRRFICFVKDREPENLIPRWYIAIRLDERSCNSGSDRRRNGMRARRSCLAPFHLLRKRPRARKPDSPMVHRDKAR